MCRQRERKTYMRTDRHRYIHTGRQTDRQTDVQTNRQTYRRTGRQTNRQTDIHAETLRCIQKDTDKQ